MNSKIFCLLLQLIVSCNIYDFVNGKALVGIDIRQVESGEYSFIVGIVEINNEIALEERILCTGSLISSYHIITISDCFDNMDDTVFGVLAESNIIQNARIYDPCWWTTHNQWTTINDIEFQHSQIIAAVKLTQSVGEHVIPAPISTVDQYNTLSQQDAILVGWGKSNEGEASTVLKTASVKIITYSYCNSLIPDAFIFIFRFSPIFLCTKAEPFARITQFDVGGPLLHEGNILALNLGSFTTKEESYSNVMNYHTGVHIYRDFINDALNR